MTFSTWRGIQVTKDRVTKVSNPQTVQQMEQRMKMPMVAQMRARIEGLVNHSFQGVDYGYKSLYKFTGDNLRKGYLTIGEYVPKGVQEVGAANYEISSGSLKPVVIGVLEGNGGTFPNGDDWKQSVLTDDGYQDKYVLSPVFNGLGDPNFKQTFAGTTPTNDELLNFFLHVLLENVATDQLSFLVFENSPAYPIDETAEEKQYANYTNSYLYRVVRDMGANELNQGISIVTRPGQNWTSGGIKNISLCFNEDIAIQCQVDFIPKAGDEPGYIELSRGSYPVAADGDDVNALGGSAIGTGRFADDADFTLSQYESNQSFKMVGIINSRLTNGKWQRSSQRMVCLDYNPEFDYANVAPTYAATAAAKSQKFLNNGSDDTGINGNSGQSIYTTSSFDDKTQGRSDDEKSQG